MNQDVFINVEAWSMRGLDYSNPYLHDMFKVGNPALISEHHLLKCQLDNINRHFTKFARASKHVETHSHCTWRDWSEMN